jgi:hypothetical protein
MMSRCIALCLTALALAGCVTVPPPSLSVDQVRGLRLAAVEVELEPDRERSLVWHGLLEEFRKARDLAAARAAAAPEVPAPQAQGTDARPPGGGGTFDPPWDHLRAFTHDHITRRARLTMEGPLGRELTGSRPVRVVLKVHEVVIPSFGAMLVRSLFVGYSGGEDRLTVTTQIVDAKTGAVILTFPRRTEVGQGGYGLIDWGGEDRSSSDPLVRLLAAHREDLLSWLLRN